MRGQWILSIIFILVSMGLMVVIFGQHQKMILLEEKTKKNKMSSETVYIQYLNEDLFKTTLEKLVAQSQTGAQELEAKVAKLSLHVQTKKSEIEACQAEMKTSTYGLEQAQKTHVENKDAQTAESDVWNKEIDNLKAQLAANSPVCDYVKNEPQALKLCGSNTSKTETKGR